MTLHPALIPVGLMALANFLFGANDVWLRRISDEIGIIPALWARSAFFAGLMLAILPPSRWPALLSTKPVLQVCRATLPLIGSALLVLAMAYVPVSDVVSLVFLSPVIASVLAIPLLKEQVGLAKWVGLGIGLIGMIIIIRPGAGILHWAHALALGAALIIGLYQILTRVVAKVGNPRIALLYMAVVSFFWSTLALPFGWIHPSPETWFSLLGISIVYLISHGLFVAAFQRAEASRLAPFTYTYLLGTAIAAFGFYGQLPGFYTLIGSVLIVVAGLTQFIWPSRPASSPVQAA